MCPVCFQHMKMGYLVECQLQSNTISACSYKSKQNILYFASFHNNNIHVFVLEHRVWTILHTLYCHKLLQRTCTDRLNILFLTTVDIVRNCSYCQYDCFEALSESTAESGISIKNKKMCQYVSFFGNFTFGKIRIF